jgi:hypothetical protein
MTGIEPALSAWELACHAHPDHESTDQRQFRPCPRLTALLRRSLFDWARSGHGASLADHLHPRYAHLVDWCGSPGRTSFHRSPDVAPFPVALWSALAVSLPAPAFSVWGSTLARRRRTKVIFRSRTDTDRRRLGDGSVHRGPSGRTGRDPVSVR